MTLQIKPCPKCGSNICGTDEHPGTVYVVCRKCHHRGPEVIVINNGILYSERVDEAIRRWNAAAQNEAFKAVHADGFEFASQPGIDAIKALDGKLFAMLTPAEEIILNFYRDQGRKYGVTVTITNETDPDALANAKSKQEMDYILKSSNSVICVTVN